MGVLNKPIGFRVKHASFRSCTLGVVVLAKPFEDGGFMCPSCHVWHPVKVVHLWLDDRGEALVSQGVLDELRLGGMPELTYEGPAYDPPPLTLGPGVDRAKVDQDNRKIVQYMSV